MPVGRLSREGAEPSLPFRAELSAGSAHTVSQKLAIGFFATIPEVRFKEGER
jgi:hypothetical protein